jgi:plasmid stability protein
MGSQLTVRGVPDDLMHRLRDIAIQRGSSVNAVVLELLTQAVGSSERRRRLERYATSTTADADALEAAIRLQRSSSPHD